MYYWRVYVEGTGEIMEQGSAIAPEMAANHAKRLIERYRHFDEPDERYFIEILEGEGPGLDNVDTDYGESRVVKGFPYRRGSRRYVGEL